ncbi:MAG TPA: hypothetical protein VGE07_23285 [Herpetosiphonaceae bacterium]
MPPLVLPLVGTLWLTCGLAILADRWRWRRRRQQLQRAHLADISAIHAAFAAERAALTWWPCCQCPRPWPPATWLVDGVGLLGDGRCLRVRYPLCAACYARLLPCWVVPPSARPLTADDGDLALATTVLPVDPPALVARVAAGN